MLLLCNLIYRHEFLFAEIDRIGVYKDVTVGQILTKIKK